MRCLQCDYTLWNLTARNCPECGASFAPSDYDFVVNSVRFCCPHCDQSYYGTGEKGHLHPNEFDCVGCGQHVHMDEMVLRPAEGLEEEQTQVDRMPWLERREHGPIRSWFSMIGMAMTAPQRLMRSLPVQSSTLQPWWYAFLTWTIFWVCGGALPMIVFALVLLARSDPDAVEAILVGLSLALFGAISSLLYILVWGLTVHGLLKVSGGCAFSLGRTFAALCYSSGANVVIAVPCLGPYCGTWVGGVWHIVSAILMTMTAQRVPGTRAAFAVLAFPVVVVVIGFAAYMGLIFFSMTAPMTATFGAAVPTPTTEVRPVTTALLDYASAHEGRGPEHAVQLLAEGDFGAANFILQTTETRESDVTIGDTTLDELERLPSNRRRMEIEKAVKALPEGVIAHRLGDYVFAHHGIDLDGTAPRLWIVITSPDPEVGLALEPALIGIGCANGEVIEIGAGELMEALKEQNDIRQLHGLPPLPLPGSVTHRAPAAR